MGRNAVIVLIGAIAAAAIVGLRVVGDTQAPAATAPAGIPIAVYKTPTCGCCTLWVDHLRANGFVPTVTNLDDLTSVKSNNNVPGALQSCHTAVVDGYVIEGHVPAADIRRLLQERPAVAGLAVPGMPIGSPGMEGPTPQPYSVIAFDRAGDTSVFSSYAP